MAGLDTGTKMPVDIGSRLELLVDDFLIARMSGGAELRLNRPVPRKVVLVTDEPWEGNICNRGTVFQDGDIYRLYYGGLHYLLGGERLETRRPEVWCYAESTDGVHWVKPELGLVEFDGSKRNNIIVDSGNSPFPVRNFAPFKDANPDAAPDAKYKAWAVGFSPPRGLWPLKSPDGIRWSPMSDGPVITYGLFDSLNLAFWDTVRGEYRDYHRSEFRSGRTGEEPYAAQGVPTSNGTTLRGSRYGRDILTATSQDFIHWTAPLLLNYTEGRPDQLYSNGVLPYFRAPHILLGFPMRYVDRGWRDALEDLPELNHRRSRARLHERYGSALTDGLFMSSRDRQLFKLWHGSFIRPGLRPQGNWAYGDNWQCWGIVTTKSAFEGAPDELSIYANEGCWRGDSLNFVRYTMRVDGFVSLQAPMSGGELVTKPLVFAGRKLVINFSASAAGSIRVEILRDQMDTPVAGLALDECIEVLGDDLARIVRWLDGPDLSRLAGVPVRLRFVLRDADLFSFRFTD